MEDALSLLLVFGVLLVACFGLTHAVDLQRQESVRRLMDGLITRRGRDTLDELELVVRENRHALESSWSRAGREREAGRAERAALRLRRGCEAIEELAPDFLSGVRALRRLARTVSVIVATEPVAVHAFETSRLRGLAALGRVVHEFLLTGRQKVRLRLLVCASAFRIALRQLGRVTVGVTAQPGDERRWTHAGRLVADLGRAGDQAVVAARAIVQALDAVELGHAPVPHVDA
jgi:hypothetical protein